MDVARSDGSPRPCTDELAESGWSVIPSFLPPDTVSGLADEARALRREDAFRHAHVGRGDGRQLRTEIRTDQVLWLDETDATPLQRDYFARMEALRQDINRHLYLGLFALEAHLALYPAGAFYKRHLDAFAGGADRVLSAILYLNPAWSAADGGQLRLYLDAAAGETHVDILPLGGALVLFLADRFEHEVLPARRERLSVTGWFLRR